MSSYSEALQRHMAAYKSARLGVDAPGTFIHRGESLPYGHILPPDLKWLNILESYRSEVRQYVQAHSAVRLHKFFHHLNSSQAFAFNLFYPFFEDGGAVALLAALGSSDSIKGWEMEAIPDAEEGTNVDVSWVSDAGLQTFCEVKLSEAEFGATIDDDRHRAKLEAIYEPVLRGQCADELLQPHRFFQNYQILRYVWLAARDPASCVVFLLPRANVALWGPLGTVQAELAPQLATRIRAVAIEDVLFALAGDAGLAPRLSAHVKALQEKYLLPG